MTIKDRAEELIEGVKEKLDSDGIQIDERIAERVKEAIKKNEGKGSIVDRIVGKVVSRKLLVFAAATSLFMWFGLDTDTWGMIAMCYIGGQSAIDFAKTWKG